MDGDEVVSGLLVRVLPSQALVGQFGHGHKRGQLFIESMTYLNFGLLTQLQALSCP